MESRTVVLCTVILCLYFGIPDCLGSCCSNDGEICQNKHQCCNGVMCKKPPHTCDGVCNELSCSGSGIDRPIGMQCDDSNNQCAPNEDGTIVPCKRPKSKRCNGICKECGDSCNCPLVKKS